MAHPNVSFQNLGKDINSDEPDYFPIWNKDETFWFFHAAKKTGSKSWKRTVTAAVIFTQVHWKTGTGRQQKRRPDGKRYLDEQAVGLRWDGLEMYVYEDHIEKFGEHLCFNAPWRKRIFMKPKMLDGDKRICRNQRLPERGWQHHFLQGKKMLATTPIFIWAASFPTVKWVPLPASRNNINTPYNEGYALSGLLDGQTLYFAGARDTTAWAVTTFKTVWNQKLNVFSNPETLYPINTTDDDRSICVTADKLFGLHQPRSGQASGHGELIKTVLN